VRLVDVRGQESETESQYNLAEVAAVMAELQRLNAAATQATGTAPLEVAVITGYAAQLHRLKSALGHRAFDGLAIRFGSVDRFQGDEEEVVIFFAVRTIKPGFLRDRPRINVAFSRARSLLIVCAHVQRARSGRLARPLQDVVRYVDARVTAGDDRYVLEPAR
jgi:superfamily I DNA and/or RNA helicase